MRLASLKVGGVQVLTQTLLSTFRIDDKISDRIATCTFTVIGMPADLNTILVPGAVVEIYKTSATPGSGSEFGAAVFGQATFGPVVDDPAERIFYGTVATIAPIPYLVNGDNTGHTQYTINCQTFGALLNTTIITTAVTYTAESDLFIINNLFSTYLPGISMAGVDNTVTVPTITFDNISLRQALENLCGLTGANFYVDTQKVLQYHLPTATAAPFGISENPDNSATFAPLYQPTYLWDFSNGSNRVKVIGALGSGGVPITSTRNDTTSQGLYGIMSVVIVDRNITSTAQADARGDVQLANYSNPLQTGTFATYKDGLAVDQLVALTLPSINVSGSFLITEVITTFPAVDITKYVISWGTYKPDLYRAMRKALTYANSPTTPIAIPAPFSVTPTSFAGTIQPVLLVPGPSNPALPNSSYPVGTIIENVTDLKLYKNITNTSWDAVVNLADLPGQIGTTQISNSAITTPLLAANAVTATNILAGAVVAGKLAANSVIAGTVAAGAIRASDAAFAAAAIQTADIGNLQVTDAKINSLTASKLTAGTIDASVINVTNLNATNIVSGTLNCALLTVTNLNASSITTGTLSAARISAGTAAIGTGAIVINGSGTTAFEVFGTTSLHNDLNVGGSAIISTDLTVSGSTFLQGVSSHVLTCTGISVLGGGGIGTSGNVDAGTYSVTGVTIYDGAGNNYANSYNVGGSQVVKNRRTGWTSPTGTDQRSGFATSTATLTDVAQTLKSLIADLTTHGLIGT